MNTFFFTATQNILCTLLKIAAKQGACYTGLSDDEDGDDEDDQPPETTTVPSTTTGGGAANDDEELPPLERRKKKKVTPNPQMPSDMSQSNELLRMLTARSVETEVLKKN